MESKPTRIMVAVNESAIKGYQHASISSRGTFDWTLGKIVGSNTTGFTDQWRCKRPQLQKGGGHGGER
ncbi:hypothetical protein SLA2020_359950 [Shorea laevis]